MSKERVSLPVERSMLAIIFNGFVKKNAMHMQSDSRMFKLLATAIRTDWRAFNIPEDVDSPLDMILRKVFMCDSGFLRICYKYDTKNYILDKSI